MTKKHKPITLFISYAHEDDALREKLEKHLKLLQRQGIITTWHDRQIMPGSDWAHEIDVKMKTSSIILLLVSSDFLGSDYCYEIEMKYALERHGRGEARVIPIILRPCDWREAPFAYLEALPHHGEPVTEWRSPDAAFLNIAQGLRKVIKELGKPPLSSPAPLSPLDRQNRMRLLKQVRATWIEGVLEHSLHQDALISLNFQEEPGALANPWHLHVQETNLPSHPLQPGTSIAQIYDEADGQLFILGKPGAGKTTLLLEITRTLLERAEKDERQRMPIVFNLTSWAEKPQPLSTWMVEELSTKYSVPRKMGQNWIDTDQVLPLLDGLDEVAKEVRTTCVQQINNYSQWRLGQSRDCPMVVCCRSKEYAMLSKRSKGSKNSKNSTGVKLKLRRAISILPLTDEQINTYLKQVGEQAKGLKQALDKDTELLSLVREPVMLNIFTLAYQGATVEEISTGGTLEEAQYTIFARYVKSMLNRRGRSKRWKPERVIRWLTFLAKQMQQHDQTVFSVENLQQTWLPSGWEILYKWCMAPVIGLLSGLADGLVDGLLIGLPAGLFWGLVFANIEGKFGMLPPRSLPSEHLPSPNEDTWRNGKAGLVVALVGELVGGSLFGLIGWLIFGQPRWLVGELVFLPFLTLGPFIRHFLLRFFLSWRGDLPWNLVPFLDETAERLLLRKVGGSYIFAHRLLLDYFASLGNSESTYSEDKREEHDANV